MSLATSAADLAAERLGLGDREGPAEAAAAFRGVRVTSQGGGRQASSVSAACTLVASWP